MHTFWAPIFAVPTDNCVDDDSNGVCDFVTLQACFDYVELNHADETTVSYKV